MRSSSQPSQGLEAERLAAEPLARAVARLRVPRGGGVMESWLGRQMNGTGTGSPQRRPAYRRVASPGAPPEAQRSTLARLPTPMRNQAAQAPPQRSGMTTVMPAGSRQLQVPLTKRAKGWLLQCRGLLTAGRSPRNSTRLFSMAPVRGGAEYELAYSLYNAVDCGDRPKAEVLLKRGARLEYASPGGWTPLLRAVYRGDMSMLQLLLQAGAVTDHGGRDGDCCTTPLELCVLRGYTVMIPSLLEAKANPAAQDYSALRQALETCNKEALQAFGSGHISLLYNQDSARIKSLEMSTGAPERARGEKAKETARRRTLQGTKCDEAEDFSCVVCLEAPRAVLLQPCLHLVLCSGCASSCKICPICRRDAKKQLVVYLS